MNVVGSSVWPGALSPQAQPQAARAVSRTLQFSGTLGDRPYQGPVTLYFAGVQRKLMSYNAERLYHQADGTIPKTAESMAALAEAILKEDPDVLALQEVGDRATLEWFNRKYLQNRYPNIVSVPMSNGGNIQVAMMAKRSIRVVETRSHWDEFSKAGPYQGKRDFLEATFQTGTGYRFTVFNVHCKSMVGGEDKTHPVRMEEARVGARILNRMFNNKRYKGRPHVFLTGDFNSLHNSPLGRDVLDTFALKKDRHSHNDLTEVMLKDGKEVPTHNGRDPGGVQRYPDSKLDYTFVSKAVLQNVVDAYVAGNFQERPWSEASDHLPLVTVFEEPEFLRRAQQRKTRFGAGRLDLIA